jgi:hypothetical protein
MIHYQNRGGMKADTSKVSFIKSTFNLKAIIVKQDYQTTFY